MPSSHIATPDTSLPDVPTFLSDLASALQGRSLIDLPHVTFPAGTFILVALPVNITQQQTTTNQNQSGTGEGRSRRHAKARKSDPNETPTKMDGILHQDPSHQSRHQREEGKAYNMLCDIINGYADLNTDQRSETHVKRETSHASQNTAKSKKSNSKSSKKPAKKPASRPRCVATKADDSQCTYKAHAGFQTCGIAAHRRQDPEYSSDEGSNDADA